MVQTNLESIIDDSLDRIWWGEYQVNPAEFVDASNVMPGDVVYLPTNSSAYVLEVAATNEVAVSGLLSCVSGKVKVRGCNGKLTSQLLKPLNDVPASIYTNFESLIIGRRALVIPSVETPIGSFYTGPVGKGLKIISMIRHQEPLAGS